MAFDAFMYVTGGAIPASAKKPGNRYAMPRPNCLLRISMKRVQCVRSNRRRTSFTPVFHDPLIASTTCLGRNPCYASLPVRAPAIFSQADYSQDRSADAEG